MGRMKELSVLAQGRGRWVDATRRVPCPICGATSWCGMSPDGAVVLCKRVEGKHHGVTRDGVTYYLHRLDSPVSQAAVTPSFVIARERASDDVCDRAYRVLLGQLGLDPVDREMLAGRGFATDDIEEIGYRTLPVRGRARLAKVVVDAVGEAVASQVPGVVWRTADDGSGRGWWSVAGCPGVLVPVRNIEGKIVAMKVRRRDLGEGGPRYLYVSSARHGGPSAVNAVHVPRRALDLRPHATRLVLTEGEVKADLSTALLGEPVASVPGVGAWRAGLDLAKQWRPPLIVIAYDTDASKNPVVARHRRDLREALERDGFRAAVWTWSDAWKGLDDFLVARRRSEVCRDK